MQIVIKKLDGQKENFNFEEDAVVSKVKEILAEKAGIDRNQVRLIFKGQPMLDEKSLKDHQVTPNAVIHMIAQLRG